MGGPTIIFHRHAEIRNRGNYHDSVYHVPNGEKYKKLVSWDFNALYAYAMKMNLPTGMPFYYRISEDGNFKFEIAGATSGWSMEAMDWLNHASYDKRFLRDDGTFYPMFSAVTGESVVDIEGQKLRVDGCITTDTGTYFLEYFGCRKWVEFVCL